MATLVDHYLNENVYQKRKIMSQNQHRHCLKDWQNSLWYSMLPAKWWQNNFSDKDSKKVIEKERENHAPDKMNG